MSRGLCVSGLIANASQRLFCAFLRHEMRKFFRGLARPRRGGKEASETPRAADSSGDDTRATSGAAAQPVNTRVRAAAASEGGEAEPAARGAGMDSDSDTPSSTESRSSNDSGSSSSSPPNAQSPQRLQALQDEAVSSSRYTSSSGEQYSTDAGTRVVSAAAPRARAAIGSSAGGQNAPGRSAAGDTLTCYNPFDPDRQGHHLRLHFPDFDEALRLRESPDEAESVQSLTNNFDLTVLPLGDGDPSSEFEQRVQQDIHRFFAGRTSSTGIKVRP